MENEWIVSFRHRVLNTPNPALSAYMVAEHLDYVRNAHADRIKSKYEVITDIVEQRVVELNIFNPPNFFNCQPVALYTPCLERQLKEGVLRLWKKTLPNSDVENRPNVT